LFGIPLGGQKTHFENAKPKFVFDNKKKLWFVKNFAYKNHVLRMKLKTSFPKRAFDEKHNKKMGSQTNPKRNYQNFLLDLLTQRIWV
jgi:hypothetical protein